MTPSTLLTRIRQRYNATADNFFSDDEIYSLITDASVEMARETQCIEGLSTTSSVAAQQAYDFPTGAIGIKRITYDGQKVKPITLRDDDAVTGLNQSSTAQGTPRFYWVWNKVYYFRPIPDGVYTIKLWTYKTASEVTSSSTLEIPEEFHMRLIDYALSVMSAKDSNFNAAQYYDERWQKSVGDVRAWVKKYKRTDSFIGVQDENLLVDTYLGTY